MVEFRGLELDRDLEKILLWNLWAKAEAIDPNGYDDWPE